MTPFLIAPEDGSFISYDFNQLNEPIKNRVARSARINRVTTFRTTLEFQDKLRKKLKETSNSTNEQNSQINNDK